MSKHHTELRFADVLPRMPIGQPDCVATAYAPIYRYNAMMAAAAVPTAPVLVVDNVADYLWANNSKRWDYTRDFPPCTPAFSRMFVEWKRPAAQTINKAAASPQAVPALSGVLVERYDADKLNGPPPATDRAPEHGDLGFGLAWKLKSEKPIADAKWYVAMHHVTSDPAGHVSYYSGTTVIALDATGRNLVIPATFVPDPEGQRSEAMRAYTAMDIGVVMLALGFCHLKNVEQHTINPSSVHSAGRQRHGHLPLVTYKVLVIDPNMGSKGGGSTSKNTGDPLNRLHIVRGHVAHYSEEKPLFGLYSGWFWKPEHRRGSESLGVVVKDYTIGVKGKPLPEPALAN